MRVVLTDGTLKYVYGLGLAYAVDTSGNLQIYHTDGLGSVRAITNGSNKTIIDVLQRGQDVAVCVTRSGRDFGYQVIETVTRSSGTKNVVQSAYDDQGNLIHYDPTAP